MAKEHALDTELPETPLLIDLSAPHNCSTTVLIAMREIYQRLLRRSGYVIAVAAASALTACGGGEVPADNFPSALNATQATQSLTAEPRTYPAALAIRVSTLTIDQKALGGLRAGETGLSGGEKFPVGSVTKSMTATLAAVLVQEQKLNWSTQLKDVFPELSSTMRPEYKNVDLRDLLSHRGGTLPATTELQISQLPAISGTPRDQRVALTNWLLSQPSTSTPSKKTQYSNGDYVVAAAMLERVTGTPYEVLLQEKVFSPLGGVIAFGTPGRMAGETWTHVWKAGRWNTLSPTDEENQFPDYANPAGGVKISAPLLARYLQMHLRAYRGLTGEILTPSTAKYIHTVVQDGFALGWQQGEDFYNKPIHWHNGSDDNSYYAIITLSLLSDSASAVVVTGMRPQTEADVSEAVLRLLR